MLEANTARGQLGSIRPWNRLILAAEPRRSGETGRLEPANCGNLEQIPLALVWPDYDVTIARLRAAGHDIDPRREHWGSPRSYVRDPAGNLIELMAYPPGRADGASREQ